MGLLRDDRLAGEGSAPSGSRRRVPIKGADHEPPDPGALEAWGTLALRAGQLEAQDGTMAQPDDVPFAHRSGRWSAHAGGFDIHAGVRAPAGDHVGRERLCKYVTRPPWSASSGDADSRRERTTFRCAGVRDCGYVAEVPAPTAVPGAWYRIEVRRRGSSMEVLSYDLSVESAAELPCATVLPSGAAEPCLIPLSGTVAGTLASPLDRDELWFDGERGRIYVVAVDGAVNASLHSPASYDPATTASPGTSDDDSPMFRFSPAWPYQIAFVAPVGGRYGLLVDEGRRARTNYTVRIYESQWRESDLPTITEWAGGTCSP